MYGFQGNNSQSYNYQNPNGSFGNISQYTGPYHPYYSNAAAAYNAFPSNEAPCSSLGIIPQEYNQGGNGIPRPYFYDTNSTYPRPYQGLPFNQSMDLPIANSFNACPRNCHCCEPLKSKYFNSSNAVPQQASVKNPYDPSLNAAYNGLRKSFEASAWRESNPQITNLKDSSDSTTSWSIPKYGNGYKNETSTWPLPQRQITKFEGNERMGSANNYILSQQHQRIALPNSQVYSNMHSNSIRTIPSTCPSPGRNEDLLGSSLVGYQRSSFSDLPQNNSESHPYPKSSVNSVKASSRTACNLPCGGSFTCRYSTSTSQVINENQKCVVESPKAIAPLPGTLVDSFQRRFVTNNVREEVKDNSYYQSGVLPSANSVNTHTRRVFNAQNESDATFRLNCNTNESINPVVTSRLQLPPIQSLRPSGMLFRHSSREYNQVHTHLTPKSGQQNLNEEVGSRIRRSTSLANAPVRDLIQNTSDRYCNSTQPESFNKTLSGNANNSVLLNNVYGNQYMEDQGKDSLDNSRVSEGSSKLNSVINSHSKISSSNISSGISDLRHFLSTWDDVDEEDTLSSAQDVVSEISKDNMEACSEEISVVAEYPPSIHKQFENSSCSNKAGGDMPSPVMGQKELPIKGLTYPVDPSQCLGHNFESDSLLKSANLNETEITTYETNTALKNNTDEDQRKKEISSQYQAKRSFSYSELSTCGDLNNCASSNHPSNSLEIDNHGCMSFLDLNTCESEVGYVEKVPSEERILETRKRKKEYKEILHSSEGTSLKILSLDLAVQGSSITQNKSNAYKIQNYMEPKKDIPIIQKTFFSCESKSEGKNLDHQNRIVKETNNGGAIMSSEKGSIGTSNKAKSESISSESDTMVFYNLTARVDVTLERLEVPSISINERNDCSTLTLKANGQTKRTQGLASDTMNVNENTCSEINQTTLKRNEECTFTSSDNEFPLHVVKETDHDFEVKRSSSVNDGDESMSQTEDSVCTKKSCLILPCNGDESTIEKHNVGLEIDHSEHKRSLMGSNETHNSKDVNLLPDVGKVTEILRKETDENQGRSLDCIESDSLRGANTVKEISDVQKKIADGHTRTSPCFSEIHESEEPESITEVGSVSEMSKKLVEKVSLDNNQIDGVRLAEMCDKNKDIIKVPCKESNEHTGCSLGSNDIHNVVETLSVTEEVSVPERCNDEDVSERSLLANHYVRGVKSIPEIKDDTKMPYKGTDEPEGGLRSNEICSFKEVNSVAKDQSLSEGCMEGSKELGESFIDNNVVHDCKGSRTAPGYVGASGKLRKETDVPNFKISHSCRKRKAKKSVTKCVDGPKYSRTLKDIFISKYFRKTTCKVIMSIIKKYRFFHLSKDKRKSHPDIIHKIRPLKKNAKIKYHSNILPKRVCERNTNHKRIFGKKIIVENVTGDSSTTHSKDVEKTSDESKNVNNDILQDRISARENVLPTCLCLPNKEIEGLTSSQYLCCSDNEGELAEGNVILNVEEKEIVLEGLGEGCVIGNVEVFMGIEGGEGSTIEENEKESSFALGPPIEELLEEDTVGVQYWNSYELDNSLGVAMEVEVGSEIESDAEMVLLDHVKVEDTADSESNNKSIGLGEENLDTELLEKPSSPNKSSNKTMDIVVCPKNDICVHLAKRETEEETVCLPDSGKSVSFYEKGSNNSTEVMKGTDISHKNGLIFDDVEPTEISSPSNIFFFETENDSKASQDTTFLTNNISNEIENLKMKGKGSIEGESFKTKNDFTSPDLKVNSLEIRKGLHSMSNLRQFQHHSKNERKTVIEKDRETDMRCYELYSLNISNRKKTLRKKGSSTHFFTSKKKMLNPKRDKSLAKINIEAGDDCIVPIRETLVDRFSVKKDEYCEISGGEVTSANVDEDRDKVKVNASSTISKCSECPVDVSKKIIEPDVGKNSSCCEGNLKKYNVPSQEVKYRILSPCTESSENNLLSEQWREKEGNGSSGSLQEQNVKVKKRKNFKFSSKPAVKNYPISQSSLHKFSRYGFWKARKWPYSCMFNRKKPLKKISKTFGVPAFSAKEKNTLPPILELYPNPPFLSPLPAFTDSLASDTHNLSISQSSSEKDSNEDLPQMIHSQCSEDLLCIVQSKNESDHLSLHVSEDSNKSIVPLPDIDSDSSKITNIQYCMPLPSTEYISKEQNMSDSPNSKADLIEKTKNIDTGGMQSANPCKLLENDFSISSSQSPGTGLLPNENLNPRVCITFKKVGIADRNEKWMKASIVDEFSENQEVKKGQFIQNRTDHSFESPLPKVTIKKKNGEEGYQSFLSGFSSYSPLPSSPVNLAPQILVPPNSESNDLVQLQDVAQETYNNHGMKSSENTVFLKSDANATDMEEVYQRRNSPAFDEAQSGLLEKKAGSGLVFVIRGFGNHVKEDHPKKSITEPKVVSCKQMETSDRDGILSQISENYSSSEDEGLESIPWSIWQPVVKLSRSCELDALARELCNTDEDSEIGEFSQKQHQHSRISDINIMKSSSQEKDVKNDCGSLKPLKDGNKRKDSDESEGRLKRNNSEKKVEVGKKQFALIRSLSLESPKNFATISQKQPKKLVHEKSFDAALQQIEEVEEKKMQLGRGKSCGNFKVLNESLKQVMFFSKSDTEEKYLLQSNLPVPISPLKIKSETNPVEKRKEKMDFNVSLQKEKTKRLSPQSENTETVVFLDCVKDEPKNSTSGMKISKDCSSFIKPELNDDPGRGEDINIDKEIQNGKNKVPPIFQGFQSNKSSKEKLTYTSRYSEKDSSSNTRRKKRRTPLFQCESCCRRFSSEKWLSRHCKGVSHTRVENAQRVAVQALLLLLTGDESKSLRPLSEVELANLKTWSSRSAPSPLQVALKELLHPAKDHML